jgi:hypothetical protein
MILVQFLTYGDSAVGLYAFPDESDPNAIIDEWEETSSKEGQDLEDFLKLRGVERVYCEEIYIEA